MKILNVNKFFYRKGGAETYFFALTDLLRMHGHEVIHFSMQHPKNERSDQEPFFVNQIDYAEQKRIGQKAHNAQKILFSFEAKEKITRLVEQEKPDIAHLQNFHHQLSPSILYGLKKHGVPIVYTAHDFKLVCANYIMMTGGQCCEACGVKNYRYILKNRCVKNSLSGSLVNYIEMKLHRLLKSTELIDRIITPSQFVRDRLIAHGIDSGKVVHVPNFLSPEPTENVPEGDYFVFAGRLSNEKGIMTLVKAMETASGSLYILGDGPQREAIEERIRARRLQQRIILKGYCSGDTLKRYLQRAQFGVVPSEWYENCPYAVLEMFAYGKPVIVSNLGGLPEMVEHGHNGLVFPAGDADALSMMITRLNHNPGLRMQMGKRARQKLDTKYAPEAHYQKIFAIYEELYENSRHRT